MSDQVTLRPMRANDEPYVYSNWLNSYRQSKRAREFPNDVYFAGQKRLVEITLAHSITKMACASDDESLIYGFICCATGVLHYVYVKHAFRGFGIARLMLGELTDKPLDYSHDVPAFVSKLPKGSRYNPWAGLSPQETK